MKSKIGLISFVNEIVFIIIIIIGRQVKTRLTRHVESSGAASLPMPAGGRTTKTQTLLVKYAPGV